MLRNHTTLITGAGSGLGAALAKRFVEEGSKVVLLDIDLDRARSVAAEFDPDLVLPLAADVRDTHALHTAVDTGIAKFGSLNTVIPNAGIWDYNRSITR